MTIKRIKGILAAALIFVMLILMMLMSASVYASTEEDPVPDKFKLVVNGIYTAPDGMRTGDASTTYKTVIFYGDDNSKVTRMAYCIQPKITSPSGGTVYDKDDIEILDGNTSKEKKMMKSMYYLYGGPAWGKTINYADNSGSVNLKSVMTKAGCTTDGDYYTLTHYILSYQYLNGKDWNYNGTAENVLNTNGIALVKEIVAQLNQMPVPTTELTKGTLTTTISDDVYISQSTKYAAIDENTATIQLPEGITLVNETTGKKGTGKVTLSGGDIFHLESDGSVQGTQQYTLSCKYATDYTAMKLKLSGVQDIGFSYYSGDKHLALTVEWPTQVQVELTKKDITTDRPLSGAVYGIYQEEECKNLITEMPVTDENGISTVTLNKTQDVVYVKEITAPDGYVLNEKVSKITLKVGKTSKVTVNDQKQWGRLVIDKQGEVLTGFDGTFQYETRGLKGVEFEVYEKETDTLAATAVTDEEGYAIVEELPLGEYYVVEKRAPEGFIKHEEQIPVVFTYAGQTIEVVQEECTFTNERQKVSVSVKKQDCDTSKVIAGAVFGIYNKEEIMAADGTLLVKADTLLEKITTDEMGQGHFTLDYPIGSYYIKEISAPEGYLLTEKNQEIDCSDLEYQLIFFNAPTTVAITKSSLTTGEEIPGCKLRVVNEAGDIIDEWISTNEAHIIKGLLIGKTYTLIETKPADGYVSAESIEFIIEDTMEVQNVEMKDDVTKLRVSKQDINGQEIAGAVLALYDSKGNEIEQWITTKEPHDIQMLPTGIYVLREEKAPKGYLTADDIAFEVKDTAKIQKVIMVDREEPVEKPIEKKMAPQTGDTNTLFVWGLLSVSSLLLGGVLWKKKRR